MKHLLLESSEVIHDESLLSRVNQVEAVGSSNQRCAGQRHEVTESIRHSFYILIQM